MSANIQIAGQYKQLTASANCSPVPACIFGILCSTNTNGKVTLYDDPATGTSTPITGAITLTASTYIPLPISTTKGLYAVLTGTTNITIVYAAS